MIDPSTACSLKSKHDVCPHVSRKTTTHECAAGGAHDAGLQPSDTTGPAGLGGMQGGIVVPLGVGHPVHVHGVVSRGATATHPASLREICDTPSAPRTRGHSIA